MTPYMKSKILCESGAAMLIQYPDRLEYWNFLNPLIYDTAKRDPVRIRSLHRDKSDAPLHEIHYSQLDRLMKDRGLFPYGQRKTPSMYRAMGLVPTFEEFLAVCMTSTVYEMPTQQIGNRSSNHYRDTLLIDTVCVVNDLVWPTSPFKKSCGWWMLDVSVEQSLAQRIADQYGGNIEENEYSEGQFLVTLPDDAFEACIQYAYDRLFLEMWPEIVTA